MLQIRPWRPFFYVLYYTGMRRNEVLSLEWRDVQYDHGRIHVRESKTGEGRMVDMHAELATELKRWKHFTGGSAFVFPNPEDRSARIQDIRKGWKRLCKAAKITERLTPHDLRHNFVSQLHAKGASAPTTMRLTGHKTHAMLYRYSHKVADSERQAVELMKRPDVAPVVSLRADQAQGDDA